MAVLSRAKEAQQLEECLRAKLDEIWHRYQVDRKPSTRAEYLLVLRQFTDLVFRGKL
jgi:hypothetical protein